MADTDLQLRSSPHFDRYTSLGSPIDLTTQTGYVGKPCRAIRAETNGTITLKRASDLTSKTLTFYDGETKTIAVTEITSVSGVTAVEVFW
jgi:hypothetical protein